ncbi:type II toxin-antitoxin system VapC family toxin [Nocardia goodfellowii]|uniref:Ribonuclease VapC n=1 Tax=Nocardia goodfellowii TaxID=882446 RepID=A0ABS4QB54_9NOCA|nr:type II toxin-antitoxin system VapC family toxin [Nocardia goodfellowii]MBP2188928.1 putative nucleic acid-binding protein [Nocardia goodfellowii]
MIGYLDTSAFVPLLVEEPSSAACTRFWIDADDVVSTRLLYVESAAALARAQRLGRLDAAEHAACRRLLAELWPQIEVIEVSEALTVRAAELAELFGLRGYDAVHCASADTLEDEDLVLASGDRNLLEVSRKLGISTYDSNAGE